MKFSRGVAMVALACAAAGFGGCDWFEDKTPENVFLELSGAAGTEVRLVLSTQFVAGRNEVGVTEVRLVRADTIVRVLPVDTVISVAVDRRFFVEMVPMEEAEAEVRVRLDVDDRRLYDRAGLVNPGDPFRFVYLFNEPFATSVEVVL